MEIARKMILTDLDMTFPVTLEMLIISGFNYIIVQVTGRMEAITARTSLTSQSVASDCARRELSALVWC